MTAGIADRLTPDVAAAALAAALTVMIGMRALLPRRRRLAPRLDPYLASSRSRLGRCLPGPGGFPPVVLGSRDGGRHWLACVLSVRVPSWGQWLAAGRGLDVDARHGDGVARRLRQAGHRDPDVVTYRMGRLAATVVGLAVGAASGFALMPGVGGVSAMMLGFGMAGASRHRGRLERAITRRRRQLRSEVPEVAQLLAVHLRSGHGPIEAIRLVSVRSRGPVGHDLTGALASIAGGVTPRDAYQALADTSPEPAAARLYRLLASTAQSGGDIVGPLLAIGTEVRAEQRQALARASVKRRTAMVIPLLLLVAPVMTLFVAAALPSLVFGSF